MKNLLFTLFFLLSSLSSFAQSTAQDFEFLAKSQTIVIQNAEMIKLDLERKLVEVFTTRPELLTSEDPTDLINVIEDMASQGSPAKPKVKFSAAVKEMMMDSVYQIRTIIRRYGIAVGITYAAINIGNYVATAVLIAAGQVQAAAVLNAIPLSSTFLLITITVTKVAKYRNTIKMYGGKENYKYYTCLSKDVKKSLKVKGKNGLIIPLERFSEDDYLAVSISQKNMLSKIADLFDHDRSVLTLNQLKYFLQRNNAWDKELEIINGTALSEGLKVASILINLKNKNSDLYAKVQEQFPEAFIHAPEHEFSQPLKDWSLAGFHAKDREELLKSAELIPLHSRVIDVLKIWTKCIVNFHIEDGKNMTYKGYRNLSKSVDRLEIEAELHMHDYVDEKWKNEFKNYLSNALNI